MRSPASLIALCGAALVALAANGAAAAPAPKDAYPNKPVRMVIPFAAGGFSDVVGRIVTQKLSEQLGQPVVADNRPARWLYTSRGYLPIRKVSAKTRLLRRRTRTAEIKPTEATA